MEIGKKQKLQILSIKEQGAYLGDCPGEDKGVLLPRKQVPEGAETGMTLEVFLYRDSEDRMIATTAEPPMEVGELARLEVAEQTKIGAFLKWGLERDLFLPYKEQTRRITRGDWVLVALYVDKSQRLCATMKVYTYLQPNGPYQEKDQVKGTVYQVSDQYGAFVAVDNQYFGLVPVGEIFTPLEPGQMIEGRILRIREDGKLDLTLRRPVRAQLEEDAEHVMKALEAFGGEFPFGESVSPAIVKREFQMSKNAFKKALGILYKQGKISIEVDRIYKKDL